MKKAFVGKRVRGQRWRGERGQVEAPIELFVAMIILAISLALAFAVASQTEKGKCISKLKTETEKLQSAMFEVSIASPPTSKKVVFTMPVCGEDDVNVLQFVYFDKAQYCSLCPGQYGGCWQIVPASLKKDGSIRQLTDAISCVNMAGCTILQEDDSLNCESGISLSQDACPPGDAPCETKGFPGENQGAHWNAFGKQPGEQVYEITLTKATIIGGTGEACEGEVGVVKICVKSARRLI
ncbi:hypothetical protein H0N96_00695 [Candidatus Micrarchaeota archaeon]|nr:hypothetical protein [Candidatus Micrarchaeota archaeon]